MLNHLLHHAPLMFQGRSLLLRWRLTTGGRTSALSVSSRFYWCSTDSVCAPLALDNVRNIAGLVHHTQSVVVLDIGRHTARWTSAQHRSDAWRSMLTTERNHCQQTLGLKHSSSLKAVSSTKSRLFCTSHVFLPLLLHSQDASRLHAPQIQLGTWSHLDISEFTGGP